MRVLLCPLGGCARLSLRGRSRCRQRSKLAMRLACPGIDRIQVANLSSCLTANDGQNSQ